MIEVKYYQGLAAREAAAVAVDNHLYVDGWYLIVALSMIQAGKRNDPQIALVFDSGRPVAVAVDEGFEQIMAYCKPSHRRRGLATMAVNTLSIDPLRHYADTGIPGSQRFWESVHVDLRSRTSTEAFEL